MASGTRLDQTKTPTDSARQNETQQVSADSATTVEKAGMGNGSEARVEVSNQVIQALLIGKGIVMNFCDMENPSKIQSIFQGSSSWR